MKKPVTIRDIANQAGVSLGTASNVLNNKPNVDLELKNRVEEAMRKLNYRVNIHARGMILKRSFNVGVVIPSLTDPFFPRFADALENQIEEKGSHVVISSSRNDPQRERMVCESLAAKQVDGIILTPDSRHNISYFNALIESGLPIVQLGRYYREISAPIVRADNYGAGYTAASELIRSGHTRLAHIAVSTQQSPDAQRRAGFLKAIGDYDAIPNPIVFETPSTITKDTLKEFFSIASEVTGVFADNDLLAMALIKACAAEGLRVPDDLSIISVGSFFPPEIMPLELSTFALDAGAMATAAVEILFSTIRGSVPENEEEGAKADDIVIPAHLVLGETMRNVF